MLPCFVGAPGPQFSDAQIHERECPVVGRHGQLVCLCCGAERRFQCARGLASPGQVTAPAGELDVEDGQVHLKDALSLCRDCRREAPGDVQMGGGLVEQAVEDVVDRERCREISIAQMGVGRELAKERVERLAPAGHRQREVVVQEQASSGCPVTGRLIVADGFEDVAFLFVPGGCSAVAETGSSPARRAAIRGARDR